MFDERINLQHEIEKILSKKKFTEEAKNKLLQSILFVYDNYNPPKYIRKTREEYINEYLRVLENMNGYAVVDLNEINDSNEVSTYFKKEILKSSTRSGNLDFINGKYVPTQNGEFYCSCKGFAWSREKMMFSLDEGNILEELMTIHHEMTHLSEGERPFSLGSQVPLSFELRKMFLEGHAVTREANIKTSSDYYQIERISDQSSSFKIESEQSYPLYGKLYQTLELIFGVDVLEEFASNNNREFDMFEELKKRFPELPVNEIFAHLIYVISCKENTEKKVLIDAIKNIDSFRALILSREVVGINREEQTIANLEQSILGKQSEIERLTALLNNPEKLQSQFQKECETIKNEIEEWHKAKEITEEEYQKMMKEFEIEATLENYSNVKKQELEQTVEDKKREEELLKNSRETLSKLNTKYQMLLQDDFGKVLEQICIQSPSLESSFSFLETTAFEKIRGEYSRLSDEDKKGEKGSILIAQIQKLFDLKEYTIIVDEKQKTSLVS